MNDSSLIGLALLTLLGGCQTTHHARVDDGAGLHEGSGVMVSGVRVGEVREVVVIEGQVDVAFVIEDAHDVTLRADSCAMAIRGEGEPTLIIVPGAGEPLPEGQALPQCDLGNAELRGLIQQFGDTVGGVLRNLLGGGGSGGSGGSGGTSPLPGLPNIPGLPFPGAPPAPSDPDPDPPNNAPLPPPPSFDGTCDGLSARVDSVEAADAVPLVMPEGGQRVWLVFSNDTDRPMRVGSVSQAVFTDSGRQTLTPTRVPSEACAWYMPFDIPAHGTARKCVLFGGSGVPSIDEIEARRSAPASDPLDWCTLRGSGLAR